ncbi:DedA family protein [Rothia sp. ZJ1223]|uniref:DedA family protein n=1 Tax=Rothia sp. ZJ1223 TaxID=2811098 RepID=UPI00195F048C|nr:hypothetical protein [Rothia sp. ZJ1223]MBM7051157.1 hypothetical protein [Rothia sp. ZJ1223]
MKEWIDNLSLVGAVSFFWAVGIARTSIVYSLGRLAASGGQRWERVRSVFKHPAYQRAQKLVNTWGVLAVPACFLTVGLQTAVIMTTGFTKMPLVRWIPAMLAGTLIWGSIYGTVGMAVVWAWLERPWIAALLAVAALISVFLLVRRKHRRASHLHTHSLHTLPATTLREKTHD